jgi:alpha-glucosidase
MADMPQPLLDAQPLGPRRPRADERDRSRTPMQWSGAAKAGFTRGEPWLPVSPQAATHHAEGQMRVRDSIFNWYRRLLRLRRQEPAFREGAYVPLESGNASVFAFGRSADGGRGALVALNMSGSEQQVRISGLPSSVKVSRRALLASPAQELAGNSEFTVAPWGIAVFRYRE